MALFSAANQLYWLNSALKDFDAVSVVPMVGVTSVIGQTLGSVCLFQEYSTFSTTQWVLFPVAVMIICIGIYQLAQREHGLVEPSISPRKRRPGRSPTLAAGSDSSPATEHLAPRTSWSPSDEPSTRARLTYDSFADDS